MEKSINTRGDFLLSDPQNKVETKYEKKKRSECNKRKPYKYRQICLTCNRAKKIIVPSGNKVIDDFVRYTQTNFYKNNGKMIFVPYEKFINIELIGGGFSKIYKATWIDCKISESGTLDFSRPTK
jgi:hypothetical protein